MVGHADVVKRQKEYREIHKYKMSRKSNVLNIKDRVLKRAIFNTGCTRLYKRRRMRTRYAYLAYAREYVRDKGYSTIQEYRRNEYDKDKYKYHCLNHKTKHIFRDKEFMLFRNDVLDKLYNKAVVPDNCHDGKGHIYNEKSFVLPY